MLDTSYAAANPSFDALTILNIGRRNTYNQGRSQDFISGVEHFQVSASWRLAEPPPPRTPKNFENFQIISLKNCQKRIIFAYITQNLLQTLR